MEKAKLSARAMLQNLRSNGHAPSQGLGRLLHTEAVRRLQASFRSISHATCHAQCSVTQTGSSTLELCRKTVPKLRKEQARKGPGLFLAELITVLHAWFYPLESMRDAFVIHQSNAAAAQNSRPGRITATLEQGLIFAF